MKRSLMLMVATVVLACGLAGCGTKDYSFEQAKWDKNDLYFVELTADSNEAYRCIRYFAENYPDYRTTYFEEGGEWRSDCIAIRVPSIQQTITFYCYVMEDEEAAKSLYEDMNLMQGDGREDLKYCDESAVIYFNDSTKARYIALSDKCVVDIRPVAVNSDVGQEVEKFLKYMD